MKSTNIFPKTIAYIMAFIFLYACASKFFDLNKFFIELGKSPLIPFGWNNKVGYGVVIIEFLVFILVIKNKFKIALLFVWASPN